jgi:limonene-1,2-epoxide hydrolase
VSATKQILATIELFNEAFNRHDVDAVMKLMTPDIIFENTSGGRFEGQDVVHAVLTRAFDLMSVGGFDTEAIFAAGDRCVVLWAYTFDQEEPERGRMRGVDIFHVRDGLFAEKFSYVKSEEFVQKLGLQIPRM